MAIINTICLLAMVIGSLFYMSVHRKGTFILDKEKKLSSDHLRASNRDSTRLFVAKTVALLITIGAAVQYFLTEDLSYNFKLYNNWTIFQAALLALMIGVMLFGAKNLNEMSSTVEAPADDDWDDDAL